MIQEAAPVQALGFQSFEIGPSIAQPRVRSGAGNYMTLKIERFRARVRLSGELRSEDLDQVKTELQQCGALAVLDLEEVNLANVEGVRFLNACESAGVSIALFTLHPGMDAAGARPTGSAVRAVTRTNHSKEARMSVGSYDIRR